MVKLLIFSLLSFITGFGLIAMAAPTVTCSVSVAGQTTFSEYYSVYPQQTPVVFSLNESDLEKNIYLKAIMIKGDIEASVQQDPHFFQLKVRPQYVGSDAYISIKRQNDNLYFQISANYGLSTSIWSASMPAYSQSAMLKLRDEPLKLGILFLSCLRLN